MKWSRFARLLGRRVREGLLFTGVLENKGTVQDLKFTEMTQTKPWNEDVMGQFERSQQSWAGEELLSYLKVPRKPGVATKRASIVEVDEVNDEEGE